MKQVRRPSLTHINRSFLFLARHPYKKMLFLPAVHLFKVMVRNSEPDLCFLMRME